MTGTILDVVNCVSFWLLVVNTGQQILEQAVEPRFLADIISAEGLSQPSDLVGREVELSEDGMTVAFV